MGLLRKPKETNTLSIAFFKTAGTEWLYSGVITRNASASAILWFHARTRGEEYVGSLKSPTVSNVSENIGNAQSRRSSTSTSKPPWLRVRSMTQGATRSAARPGRVLPMMMWSFDTMADLLLPEEPQQAVDRVLSRKRRSRRRSWVNLGAVAQVKAERLHDMERRAGREHVGRCEHAGVLFDDRCCGSGGDRVQIAPYCCPRVLAVLDEERRGIDRLQRGPGAGGDIRHVLLMHRDVVAGAEPPHVTADEVLPGVGKRGGGGVDVPRHIFGEVALIHRCPARVDDVDQHERFVVGQVNDNIVRRVVVAEPRQLDPPSRDLQCAAVLERLLGRWPSRVVVTKQELPGLLVADPGHVLVEQ